MNKNVIPGLLPWRLRLIRKIPFFTGLTTGIAGDDDAPIPIAAMADQLSDLKSDYRPGIAFKIC